MTIIQLAWHRHRVPVTILAAATAAALLSGAMFAFAEPRILVAPIAILLVVVVARLPQPAGIRLLVVLLALQGFPGYFTGYFPTGTLFADDAVVLMLVVAWGIRTIVEGQYVRGIGATGGWCVLLIGYMGGSLALHRSTPLDSQLFGIWQIVYLWPIGFMAASTLRSAADVRRMLTLVWRLGWLQVLVVALEWPILAEAGYFTAVPPVDWFAGTFGKGGAHMLGIWISMMILLAIALWLHGVMRRRDAVIVVTAFLFVLISGSTRQMYVVLPVAIAIVLALSPLRVTARAVLVVAVPLLLLGFFRVYSVATQMSFSVENLVVKQQQRTRLAFYTYSWDVARERGLWFGQGPGSYASTSGLRFGAPLAKQAALAFSHDETMVSATEWPVLLVELGVVGVAAVLAVFGALAWRMLAITRHARWPLTRALALGGIGAELVLLGGGFGSRSFEFQVASLHVWLVCGLAAALYAVEQQGPGEMDGALNE